jgi:hypothetical protein
MSLQSQSTEDSKEQGAWSVEHSTEIRCQWSGVSNVKEKRISHLEFRNGFQALSGEICRSYCTAEAGREIAFADVLRTNGYLELSITPSRSC